MGIALPQVVTSDRASGAQVIDGSLKFDDDNKQYLKRTFSSGNSRTWTWSAWIKRDNFGSDHRLFTSDADANNQGGFKFVSDQIQFFSRKSGTFNINLYTSAVLRDTGWYHLMVVVDTTISSPSTDRVKIYVNGVLQSIDSSYNTYPSENYETRINTNIEHLIGRYTTGDSQYMNGAMSQVYLIDGQALGPEYFGFTDSLTNTWRPKKYEGTFGTNGFYLPMDGNSPIGEDKSGQGNNWTPQNFGGSVALDNPNVSGARPILNTLPGGTQAGVGVFGSKQNVGYAVTVYNDGGGNKYYIDGTKQATLTGLIRGATYTFNQTDSSNSTHPLVFGTTANGNDFSNGVSITGSPGSTGITSITIPYNAPNTLYYHCSAHNNMGADITGITTNEKLADQYASNCTLALPLVGGDDDVCASIACTANNKTPTNSSVDASSTQSNFYGGSHYWSANSDSLTYAEQGSELVFGTGDFTIECWVYDDNGHNGGGSRCYIFDNRIGGSETGDPPTMVGHCDSHAEFTFYDGDSEITYSVGSTIGKWWHYAVTREGTTTRMFIDGILRGSSTSSTDFTNNGIGVGRATDANYGWAGYIQDFRIYKGVAKYTSDFVVPATSPDILPDTPSGVSGGSKLAKVNDGAVSFDGSGDYMDLPASSDFAFGTGDFTIEFFMYSGVNSLDTYYRRIYMTDGPTGNTSGNFQIAIAPTTGTINLWENTGDLNLLGTSNATNKSWNHIVAVRSGTTLKIYVNGIEEASTTYSTSVTANSGSPRPRIGNFNGSTNQGDFDGIISNLRVLKGTALYTSNFTPPLAPLTNVTNTKLLCCQSNTLAGTAAVVPGASGINDGTPWSEFVTISEGVTGTNYNDDASGAFDGGTSTYTSLYSGNMVAPYSPTTVVFTPPSPITVSSGLRVYMEIDRGQKILVNGTQTNASVSAGWNDTSFTGTLTSLTIGPSNLGSSSNISAIEVDSVILKNLVLPKGNTSATNFNPFTTNINAVRGQETGYATLNPLSTFTGTLSEGNLKFSTSGGWEPTSSTIGVNSGKWFWEYKFEGTNSEVGISAYPNNTGYTGNYAGSYGVGNLGDMYVNGTETPNPYSAFASGSTIGQELDLDNGTFRHYVNGVVQPYVTESLDTSLTWFASGSVYGSSHLTYNFGQKPFKFPPPDGFQPLNAANVKPVKVFTRPDQYVGVTTYIGDDATTHPITGLNFGTIPDFVWIKNIDQSEKHILHDTVRGIGNTLYSSSSDQADTGATYSARFKSFDFNGFTVGTTHTGTNSDGDDFVAWCWKAGGNKNTFNKDDVGYASATAAGLPALGSLDSGYTYNQSQRWSNLVTLASSSFDVAITNAFNGYLGANYTEARTAGNSILLTMTFSTPITISSSLKVVAHHYPSADMDIKATIGGVEYSSPGGDGEFTFTQTGSLTKIKVDNNTGSGRTYLAGVVVDGALLVDDNATPPAAGYYASPSLTITGASIGTKQGFSIIKYTGNGIGGATLAHGLTQAPEFVIVKDIDDSDNWQLFHAGAQTNDAKQLQFSTAAAADNAGVWAFVAPTSSVITHGGGGTNDNNNNHICYAWHSVPGLQKFGSCKGSGTSAAPDFVELGFKPSIVWVKRTDNTGNWTVWDSTRNTFNPSQKQLFPNTNGDEQDLSVDAIDILSNGFAIRSSSSFTQTGSQTYVYCAWAEAPTFNLYGAQSNAR